MKQSNLIEVITLTALPLVTNAQSNTDSVKKTHLKAVQIRPAQDYLEELKTKVRADYYKHLLGLKSNAKVAPVLPLAT